MAFPAIRSLRDGFSGSSATMALYGRNRACEPLIAIAVRLVIAGLCRENGRSPNCLRELCSQALDLVPGFVQVLNRDE